MAIIPVVVTPPNGRAVATTAELIPPPLVLSLAHQLIEDCRRAYEDGDVDEARWSRVLALLLEAGRDA